MTTVKHFHSAMAAAPVSSGTPGSRIAFLTACLVTGFGLKTADTVTVANGVATATFSGGHSFEPDVIALVAGATPAALNGEVCIAATTAGSVTFPAPGVPDGTATGSITLKIAPAGWELVFSATNVAVYRSLSPESTRQYLRVDDSSATNVRVTGYEHMSDAVTGVGMFPSATQIPDGGWWPAASASGALARAWTVVADSKGGIVHMHTAESSPGASGCLWEFGDFESLKSGDAYSFRVQCHNADASSSTGALQSMSAYCGTSGTDAGAYIARSFTALGGAVGAGHCVDGLFSGAKVSGAGGASGVVPGYPNGPDNALVLVRKAIVEPGVGLRGRSRGLYVTPQVCHQAFAWRDKIYGQGPLVGRKLLAIKCGSPAGVSSEGVAFVDITGPWG